MNKISLIGCLQFYKIILFKNRICRKLSINPYGIDVHEGHISNLSVGNSILKLLKLNKVLPRNYHCDIGEGIYGFVFFLTFWAGSSTDIPTSPRCLRAKKFLTITKALGKTDLPRGPRNEGAESHDISCDRDWNHKNSDRAIGCLLSRGIG